jgi:hypothetical protein
MSRLTENIQIVSAIVPVNLATGANNGDWVSLKNYGHCAIVVFKGAGTAGDDPVITVRQATDVAGTSAKALNFTRVDKKVGTQTGIGTFTVASQAAANTHTDTDSAEAEGVFVVEFDADELDIANGFDCVQVQIPDTGTNAQIGCALYLLSSPRYGQRVLPSAIVD